MFIEKISIIRSEHSFMVENIKAQQARLEKILEEKLQKLEQVTDALENS